MALEVRHNRAKHTHENIQFRRVASNLKNLFIQKGWDGLLIGNPTNDEFCRFRADAILLYNYGFMIIDFKDYRGNIDLPGSDRDFRTAKWYNETDGDKQRIMIKAGSQFINPFAQLNSYRGVMKEIISSNDILRNNVDETRTCIINVFSGPIEINRDTPRCIPYYKIISESDMPNFLYDYSSVNSYSSEVAEVFNFIFPAEVWEENIEVKLPAHTVKTLKIDSNVDSELINFLKDENNGILILESMDVEQRDDWMRYILDKSLDYRIPQTEVWTHSLRIARKMEDRTGISSHSLYNTIYGGSSPAPNTQETPDGAEPEEMTDPEEALQDIVPLKSDDAIDNSALIILHEAHLVTKSMHQTELLRFGSGRLLEDMIQYLRLNDTKRKLICIGDPYLLSFGKEEESALSARTLSGLYNGNIKHYRQKCEGNQRIGKMGLRMDTANSIDSGLFNSLIYRWNDTDLVKVEDTKKELILQEWYSTPITSEPSRTILVYSHKEAKKVNLWIKRHCLNSSDELNTNDLLLVNNNVNVPDDTGFGRPAKIFNGMYLLVREKKESLETPIYIKQSKQPVMLSFTKIKVKCLSLQNTLETDIWLLNNYFKNDNVLSEHEQIAFRILINLKIQDEQKKSPFEKSKEYSYFQQDTDYINLRNEEQHLNKQLIEGERVKTKLEEIQRQIRKLQKKYTKAFRQYLLLNIKNTDPIINAVCACYGWAITVHKSIGENYEKVLLNASQGETRGVTNENYFRWLYSALTSSKSIVYIANPVEIDPLINCQYEDGSQAYTDKVQSNKKKVLFFSFKEYPNWITDKLDNALGDNTKFSICEISVLLGQKGYILESTDKKGEYLCKAIYSIPESTQQHLTVAINNDRSGGISSIRIENSGGTNESVVNNCISELFSRAEQYQGKNEAENPIDFRAPIYNLWKEKCLSRGWELRLVESHSYQDVFNLSYNTSTVRFRVHYNGQGFFTKISVIEKSDVFMTSELRSLLLDGN